MPSGSDWDRDAWKHCAVSHWLAIVGNHYLIPLNKMTIKTEFKMKYLKGWWIITYGNGFTEESIVSVIIQYCANSEIGDLDSLTGVDPVGHQTQPVDKGRHHLTN